MSLTAVLIILAALVLLLFFWWLIIPLAIGAHFGAGWGWVALLVSCAVCVWSERA